MNYVVRIPVRFPGLNEIIDAARRSKYAAASQKEEYQGIAVVCIRRQLPGLRITRPVRMIYHWREPDRRRDKSNIAAGGRKIIEDALVQTGVIPNDGWKDIVGFEDCFTVDKDDVGVTIELVEVGECTESTT